MSLFAINRPCANLTQQGYRTCIYPPYSGAKWIRGAKSFRSNSASQTPTSDPLEFLTRMKGIQQPYLSIPKIFEKPLCEKISPAGSTECRASNHSIRNAGSTFEY